MLFSPEELLKDSDCPSLQKLAGLVYDLQLEFEPAEGFQTAFRMLQCYTKLVSMAALLAELSQLDDTQVACCLLMLLLAYQVACVAKFAEERQQENVAFQTYTLLIQTAKS